MSEREQIRDPVKVFSRLARIEAQIREGWEVEKSTRKREELLQLVYVTYFKNNPRLADREQKEHQSESSK